METDILIVGSGPAGISAAWPLVRAGKKVLMVDAGGKDLPVSPYVQSSTEWYKSDDRWKHILGADLGGLKVSAGTSPKFTTPLGRAVLEGGLQALPRIESENALVSRASAAGGLSTIWGGFCTAFDDTDMKTYPLRAEALSDGYRDVAKRIGMTGKADDLSAFHGNGYELLPPLPLNKPAARLLKRYTSAKKNDILRLGYARNAVLTKETNRRSNCIQCGLCLYGCGHKSIYNSADEIDVLSVYSNFSYLPQTTVTKILDHEGGKQSVEARTADQMITITSRALLLGAGTINTTALLMDHLGLYDTPVRMLCNPVAEMAFVAPKYIGVPFPEKSFGLGQLSYRLGIGPGDDYVTGVMYGADTLPLNHFAARMPFSRPTSLQLSAALAPASLMTTCYLGSDDSAMTISLKQDDTVPILSVKGETLPKTAKALKHAGRKLGGAMSRHGSYMIPGSFTISPPGSDAHLAGTVPMGGTTKLACSPQCEVVSMPGVYVIDGSWLPRLPPKQCAFTIMANATRVGTALS